MSSTRQPAPLAPVLTPGLRRVLILVLALFGLLALNSVYLAGVTAAESLSGRSLQNPVYLLVFLAHLVLGLLFAVPALGFAALHLRRAWHRPNRYAVGAGLGLLVVLILLMVSGLLLLRLPALAIDDQIWRAGLYWLHVVTPLAAVWLFLLHRLAGSPSAWRAGLAWSGAVLGLGGLGVGLHLVTLDPGPEPVRAFAPALAQTPAPGILDPAVLMTDGACAECHGEIAERHAKGLHRLSSFNNPAYRASVEETRRVLLARDGNLDAARLCAACHDPVPLFSGRFDEPHYDPDQDPGARAGITCLSCHAINAIGSPRGNGDYRLAAPPPYPFEGSDQPVPRFINRQLIRAKPALHKASLLKPLHRTPEFCSTCHKVHLPQTLNHYRWLRGQNHYDSFLLSGVSGHRVDSFYYPPQAKAGCADCHMALTPSADPAARSISAGSGGSTRMVHDHLFAAANTGVPALLGHDEGNAERLDLLRRSARIDLFALRADGAVDGVIQAPLRPAVPVLEPGRRYLLELVVRTTGMGHALTQGTADSNELWLDLTLRDGDRVIGRSGGLDAERSVDPWSYFLNAYVLDREGNRIDRRNVQDIAVALYDHQIPPGAATLVHYAFQVPADARGPISLDAALRYRKFDSGFLRHILEHRGGDRFTDNPLPIATLATDRIAFGLSETGARIGREASAQPAPATPEWERWNDFGIGLLRESGESGKQGGLRQAKEAFGQVERLGRADGPLNQARVAFREGELEAAAGALDRAARMEPPGPPWVIAWYSALVKRELGDLDGAIGDLRSLAETRFPEARARGFDFSKDYRMLTELGRTLHERARQDRGEARVAARAARLAEARARLEQALALEPEYPAAHHNLSLVLTALGDRAGAAEHLALHDRYRPDDSIAERAITRHRAANPAANHAAEAVAIYDLQRPQAFGLENAAGTADVLAGR